MYTETEKEGAIDARCAAADVIFRISETTSIFPSYNNWHAQVRRLQFFLFMHRADSSIIYPYNCQKAIFPRGGGGGEILVPNRQLEINKTATNKSVSVSPSSLARAHTADT